MLNQPNNDWTFSAVPDGFDEHVRKQLPWYDFATNCVAFLARHYLPTRGGVLYDIGASTGNMTKALADTIEQRCVRCISVEENEDMADQFRGIGELIAQPVQDISIEEFDVAIIFLTLMFVPYSKREQVMASLKAKMRKGGAIIIVDKVADEGGYLGVCLRRLTLFWKSLSGVAADDIVEKEISLAGVQRPSSREGKLFLKFGEFEGWIIEG